MRTVTTILMLAALLLAAGCDEDPIKATPGGVEYDLTTPELVVAAFSSVWEARSAADYRELLYDGATEVPGLNDCREFEFFFLNPDDPGMPGDSWYYDDEAVCAEHMFDGDQGEDWEGNVVPAIGSIRMNLIILQPGWEAANDGEAGNYYNGDAYPAGTMSAVYETDIMIILTEANAGGYDAYHVNGHAEFWVTPVVVEGVTEYRLWKWRDIYYKSGDRSEGYSFSSIKALYL